MKVVPNQHQHLTRPSVSLGASKAMDTPPRRSFHCGSARQGSPWMFSFHQGHEAMDFQTTVRSPKNPFCGTKGFLQPSCPHSQIGRLVDPPSRRSPVSFSRVRSMRRFFKSNCPFFISSSVPPFSKWATSLLGWKPLLVGWMMAISFVETKNKGNEECLEKTWDRPPFHHEDRDGCAKTR